MAAVPVTSNKWTHSDTVLKYVSNDFKIRSEYRDTWMLENPWRRGPYHETFHWAETPVPIIYTIKPPVYDEEGVKTKDAEVSGVITDPFYDDQDLIPWQTDVTTAGTINWVGHGGTVHLSFGHAYHDRFKHYSEQPGYPWNWICSGGKIIGTVLPSEELGEGGIRGCSKIKEGRFIAVTQESQNGWLAGSEDAPQGLKVLVSCIDKNHQPPNYKWEVIGTLPDLDGNQLFYSQFCFFNSAGTQFVTLMKIKNNDEEPGTLNIVTVDINVPEPKDFPPPHNADEFSIEIDYEYKVFPGIVTETLTNTPSNITMKRTGEAVIAVDYKIFPGTPELQEDDPDYEASHEDIVYCYELRNETYTSTRDTDIEEETKSIGTPGEEDYEEWTETTTTLGGGDIYSAAPEQGIYFGELRSKTESNPDPEWDPLLQLGHQTRVGTNISFDAFSFVTTRSGHEDDNVYEGSANGQVKESEPFILNALDLRYQIISYIDVQYEKKITGGLFIEDELRHYHASSQQVAFNKIQVDDEILQTEKEIYETFPNTHYSFSINPRPQFTYDRSPDRPEAFTSPSDSYYSHLVVIPPTRKAPLPSFLISSRQNKATYAIYVPTNQEPNEWLKFDPYEVSPEVKEITNIKPIENIGHFGVGGAVF